VRGCRKQFDEVIRKTMIEKFGYKNPMEVPRIDKNRAQHGRRRSRERPQEGRSGRRGSRRDLPVRRRSSRMRASRSRLFKLRENQPIGCKVTLRRKRMYEFLEPAS